MKPSRKFITALKMSDEAYKIAWAAGVVPATLSRLIKGIERTRFNDYRVIAVGRVLGLSDDECFEEEGQNEWMVD